MRNSRRFLAVAIAATAIVLGVGPVVRASIPDGDGLLHGCYLKRGDPPLPKGNLRMIDSDVTDCKNRELEVVWEALTPSDRNLKQAFLPVDLPSTLDRIDQLPITSWQYKTDRNAVRHIGPMAQDFHRLLTGRSEEGYISSIDANGIALAGVKGLNDIVRDQQNKLNAMTVVVLILLCATAYALITMRRTVRQMKALA